MQERVESRRGRGRGKRGRRGGRRGRTRTTTTSTFDTRRETRTPTPRRDDAATGTADDDVRSPRSNASLNAAQANVRNNFDRLINNERVAMENRRIRGVTHTSTVTTVYDGLPGDSSSVQRYSTYVSNSGAASHRSGNQSNVSNHSARSQSGRGIVIPFFM